MENISAADQAAIESARLELRLLQIEAQEKAQKDFLSFAKYVWPEGIFGAHHAKMADAFNRIADGTLKRLIVNMPPRHALALETRIPTTSGWKTIEQLGPRDMVFGPDGKPVKVLGKSEVFKDRQLYRVTTDDGFSVDVDGEHLWTVRLNRGYNAYNTYKTEDLWLREQGTVLRTHRNGNAGFMKTKMKNPRPPRLPDVAPVQYDKKRLLVDPYVLGVWLGDGTSRSGMITCANADAIEIRKEFEKRGYRTTDHASPTTFGILKLRNKLGKIGVLHNKHIPLDYLQADVTQRRWLLKGLIDTDGSVSLRGQCVFCQSNYDFIVQVRELLCSLGIKNSIREFDAKIGDKNYGKAWQISFYAKDIAHLQRKEERTIKTALKNGRYIRVEKLNITGDTQCIRVDREDGLFLAGEGFICTHNTKSEFSSYLLPAFIMGRQPKTKIIQATHTGELAVRFGRKVRNLMDTDEYKQVFSDVALRADSKAAGRWDTDHGGEYFAVGVGGAMTGRGADLLIIDDPHSEQDAMSELALDNAWEWYTSGPRQRLQPGGAIIIVMTRWTTKDLTARLIKAQTSHKADRWEVIEFPAILPSEKPMWPEFWKLEELLAVKASLSPQKWQAQWQQQPSNDEGAILKREWWRVWPSEEPPPVEYIIQSYDTAYSKKETADYSAITTWGVFYPDQDSGPNIILLDVTKGRWDFPELKRIAKDQYDQWQPDNVLIEAKATGITLQQELRRMGIPVTMYSPGGRRAGQDKVSRAHSVAPLFEAGMVWAPDTDWAEDLVEECAAFPNGDNDDLVDSCFVAGTQILMENGTTKSIEKIKVGEKVMTPNGPRSVTKTFDNGFKEIWELSTTTSTLHVTHDHLIKTSRGWIPVDKLQVMCDTTVQCSQQENFSWLLKVMTKLKKKACTLMEESTTDTQIVLTKHTGGILHAQAPDYTEMFGSTIRDLSLVGMLFTILTETRQTIELKILRVYRNMPTYKSTMKKWLIGEKARSKDCILTTFEKKPLRGTNRKKEDSGIKNTLLNLWKRLEKKLKSMDILKKKLHVYGVVKTLQALRFNVSFAHRDAKTLNLGLGEVKHVHNTHTMHRVYDIEVEEEHCYFAEGVLVHNCVQALNRFRAGNFISLTSDLEEEEKQQDVAFEYY
jgi:predicted phage terminase large subunit-like protein